MCPLIKIIGVFIGCSVITVALLSGCRESKSDEKLVRQTSSDAITSADGKIFEAKRRFRDTLKPFQSKQPGNKAKLRKTYEELQKAVADSNAMMQTLKVPESPASKELARAFRRFLETEETIVLKELGDSLRLIEASDGRLDLLSTLKITGSLKKSVEAEAADRKAMGNAARQFDNEQKANDDE